MNRKQKLPWAWTAKEISNERGGENFQKTKNFENEKISRFKNCQSDEGKISNYLQNSLHSFSETLLSLSCSP